MYVFSPDQIGLCYCCRSGSMRKFHVCFHEKVNFSTSILETPFLSVAIMSERKFTHLSLSRFEVYEF